jgi:hypothetical protein
MSDYSSGKDKGNLHTRANTRLNNRDMIDMELFGGNNYHNIYIERDEFLKNSKNNKTKNSDDDSFDEDNFNNFASVKSSYTSDSNVKSSYTSDSNVKSSYTSDSNVRGNIYRITDMNFDNFKDANRGMPIRGQNFQSKRFNKDSNNDNENINDFRESEFIIKKTNNNRTKIDPYSKDTKFAIFSDINENSKLSQQIENDNICVEGINDFSLFLLKNLNNVLTSPFIVNTLDIYSIFSSIYLSSQGNTEIELKNYFNFPRKDILEDGLNKLINNIKTVNMKNGNCILFNDDLTYNPEFYKLITNISKLRKINLNNIDNEVNNINSIVNAMTQHNMKNSVSSNNLLNLNILLLTFGFFKPIIIINTPIKPQILKQEFNSRFFNKIVVDYVVINNITCGYVETTDFNIVEFAIDDTKTMLGFIQPKKNIKDISEKDIINNLDKFKVGLFNKIMFPLFAIQTKLRFRNIFKKTDLKTIFNDINCPDLFGDRPKIDDLLQNVEINIFPEFKNIKKSNDNKNNKNFLLTNSFVFYLRLREKQCIYALGIY